MLLLCGEIRKKEKKYFCNILKESEHKYYFTQFEYLKYEPSVKCFLKQIAYYLLYPWSYDINSLISKIYVD